MFSRFCYKGFTVILHYVSTGKHIIFFNNNVALVNNFAVPKNNLI